MGSFKISLFLDFEPSLRLSTPFVVIIITNTFSIFFQCSPTNANIEETPSSNHSPPPQQQLDSNTMPKTNPLRPSLAVFVGLLTILLCFTFLILLYARHCRGRIGLDNNNINNNNNSVQSSAIERQHSGVDRTVIESLPLFRFKSLKGHKDGLECAVCLNKFEPTEVLRLLPKCKHAFHVECVDTWLDIHSTCPLCRYQVHPEDILLVNSRANSNSSSLSSSLSRNRFVTEIPKSPASSSSSPPPPPPLPPNQGGAALSRHSSGGERGSSSLLEVIIENPGQVKRKSTTSLISSQRSLDSRSSFSKKLIGGVYKSMPSRLSSTRSLDSGQTSADEKRKDGLLLDSSSSPSSALSNRTQENSGKPPTPRKQRKSFGGEPLKTQRVHSPFTCNSKSSLDTWKSTNKQPNNDTNDSTTSGLSSSRSLDSISQSSADRRRKDGLLLLAEKAEQHRLEHKIILAGPEMESSGEEEVLSDVQPSDMLYLQTDEMILSDDSRRFTRLNVSKSSVLREDSKSSDERKVNSDDRSVSEMTGLSRFRSNEELQSSSNGKRENDNVGGAVSKWKSWITATKHQPSSPGVDSSASVSTSSSIV